ncbi:MAG: hypothetical protein KA226_12725 [Gemmatimonadales bacterium]|nr:hypothetical protein [Gemmatimonadales bacterium]
MGHTFYTLGTTVFSPQAREIVTYATGPIKGMPVTMDGALVGTIDTVGDDEFGHHFHVDVPDGAVSVTALQSELAFKSAPISADPDTGAYLDAKGRPQSGPR